MSIESVKKLIKSLNGGDAKFARKAINYYDGNQIDELKDFLEESGGFRKNWREKGIVPRTRNITKAVVDKSGLLFNGPAPKLEVWTANEINTSATQSLINLLDSADWIETFINFDNQVRLLKSGLILVQYDQFYKKIILDALHQGNSAVNINPTTKQIIELVIRMSVDEDADSEEDTFRAFDLEFITDYGFDEVTKELYIIDQYPNPYGIIPVASFHDTNIPRYGIWNIIPTDLVSVNEMYNLHLTDSEYSAAWSKVKTLFTNASIGSNSAGMQTWIDPQTGMPRQVPAAPAVVGGPGKVVEIESGPGASVFLEYKGPDVSLMPVEEMFSQWVHDFAADWSVRLTSKGQANASSGFQLIVEEMPNLELRKQRQKMFSAGFARLYKVLTYVVAGVPGINLPVDGQLFAVFSAPSLPVDDKVQEEVWGRRITEGRASRVDYFMEIKNLSREEAINKVAEIDAFNAMRAQNQPARNTVVTVA